MSGESDNGNGASSGFEDRVQAWQDDIESGVRNLSKGSWGFILKMARKPTPEEFKRTVIVCGIGMFVLGFIGFITLVAMDDVLPSFFSWLTGA